MPDIIKLLPDAVANQIAAGEVVQRPASVVKELMENSLDAGATEIRLLIREGGSSLIQVIDNGKGMSETDARMCWERHATSKIRSANDLFSIRSFGFRGEAMASIAAVAQVEMRTRREEDPAGVLIRIEASVVKDQGPVSCLTGTSVQVKNLFFNVPARRAFLKSVPVETRHVIEEFTRIALIHPQVAFSMHNNDNEVFRLQPTSLAARTAELLGKNEHDLLNVQEFTDLVSVSGFVGKPETARKTRGDQYLFVNNRFIKSNYLSHAVASAYENLIQSDQYPMYVLHLDIDPARIDINVHPTKTEIKFDDERTVYQILKAAVRKAVGTHTMTPEAELFDPMVYHPVFSPVGPQGGKLPEAPEVKVNPRFNPFESTGQRKTAPGGSFWEKMQRHFSPSESEVPMSIPAEQEAPAQMTVPGLENHGLLCLGITSSGFIIAEREKELVFIHCRRALERIFYQQYLQLDSGKSRPVQQLLFPRTLQLNAQRAALLEELLPDINSLGFDISGFGHLTFIINGIPADINKGNETALLESVLESFEEEQGGLRLKPREQLMRSLANRAAVQHALPAGIEAAADIISRLYHCADYSVDAHGRQISFTLSPDAMADILNRRKA